MLEGVDGHLHAPANLPLERDPVALVQEAGWASWPIWMVQKVSRRPGFEPRTVRPVASYSTD